MDGLQIYEIFGIQVSGYSLPQFGEPDRRRGVGYCDLPQQGLMGCDFISEHVVQYFGGANNFVYLQTLGEAYWILNTLMEVNNDLLNLILLYVNEQGENMYCGIPTTDVYTEDQIYHHIRILEKNGFLHPGKGKYNNNFLIYISNLSNFIIFPLLFR